MEKQGDRRKLRTILGLERGDVWEPLLRGKNIGLITNYSGVDSNWQVNVELFQKAGLTIKKLFTPEHGLFGALAGKEVSDTVYPGTDIPVVSLYGEKCHPEEEDFRGIDILVYDIQDVGLRYYTYIYTMTYCMETAAALKIPFVTLDRPNPLGGRILSGGTILPEYTSFIGDYELPVRYAMTPGEIGNYFRNYRHLDIDYSVIGLLNYTRDTYFPDTEGLWNIPSPALPDYPSTVCYAGGCFVGASTLSEGRGSTAPFRMYGAPYVHMEEFYKELKNEIKDDGIMFRQRAFVPQERKYVGEVCYGIEFAPLRKDLDFIPIALILMRTAARLYPEKFQLSEHNKGGKKLDYLTGSQRATQYVEGQISLEELLEEWKSYSEDFQKRIENIRIY